MPYVFFVYISDFKSTNSWLGKKYYSLERPPYQDKRVDRPNISVSWTGMKLGLNMYFVNKQLTDNSKIFKPLWFLTWFWTGYVKQTFSEILSQIECASFEIIEKECQLW